MSSTKETLPFSTDYQPYGQQLRGDLAALSLRFSFLQELKSTDKTRYFLVRDHTKDGNQVMMAKVLSADVVDEPSELLAFLIEAQVAASLSHKNIAASTKPEQVAGIHFYLSQYPEGARTLRDLLDQKGWLEVAPFLKIASQIAQALHYAEQFEVLHLKLQPEDIWIDTDHNVTLRGFGISSRPARQWLYQKRSQQCPLLYRSPEQLANHHLDARSDLYTLGVLLYEMLTDLLPFNAQDENQLRQKIAIHNVPVAHIIRPDIPESLSAIVAKLTAANPAERFQNAAELRAALAHLADHLAQEIIVQGEPAATEKEPGPEDNSAPLAYELEGHDESLLYRFEDETEPLSLDFTDAEDVKIFDGWPSKKLNNNHDLMLQAKLQRLSPSPAPANQQRQLDKIPSQRLAADLRENAQLIATESNHQKSPPFVLLAIGIAIFTAISVLANTGDLKRFLSYGTASNHITLSPQSSASDGNSQAQSNPQAQGDSEGGSAPAQQQPGVAQGMTEAPVTEATPQALDSKPTDTGAAIEPGQAAVGATLSGVPQIGPDTAGLHQQLRKTNKAKAANHKIRKSKVKAKSIKAKPRRSLVRWRLW